MAGPDAAETGRSKNEGRRKREREGYIKKEGRERVVMRVIVLTFKQLRDGK